MSTLSGFASGRRWVVRLLVLMLCPLLIFASSEPAAADPDSAGLEVAWETNTGDDGFSGGVWTMDAVWCSFYTRWEVEDDLSYIAQSWTCASGWNIASAEVQVTYNGTGCGIGLEAVEVDGNDESEGANASEPGDHAGCSISEVCVTWEKDTHIGGGSGGDTECTSLPLGAAPTDEEPAPDGVCPLFTVGQPSVAWHDDFGDGSYGYQIDFAYFPVEFTGSQSIRVLLWYMDDDAIFSAQIFSGLDSPFTATSISEQVAYFSGGPTDEDDWQIMGVQIVADSHRSVAPPEYTWLPPGSTWTVTLRTAAETVGGDNTDLGGVDWPDACSFYYGDQVADNGSLPANDENGYPTPHGDLGDGSEGGGGGDPPGPISDPTPPDTDTGCDGFSLTDPSSWAGAGICMAVKILGQALNVLRNIAALLGDIAGFLGGLAADIAGAITGALGDLFIPSDGALDDAFGDLSAEHDTSDLGEWEDLVTDLRDDAPAGNAVTYSAGGATFTNQSNCHGPAVAWDKFEDMGLSGGKIEVMEACGGIKQDVAAVVRLLLAVVIGVGGAFKIVQMLMTAMGFSKETDTVAVRT